MYLIFAYEEHKPFGGVDDLKGVFETEQLCIDFIKTNYQDKKLDLCTWYQYEIVNIASETNFFITKQGTIKNLTNDI